MLKYFRFLNNTATFLVILTLSVSCFAELSTQTWTVVTSSNDLNFPRFAVSENGSLIMKYSEGQHTVDETYHSIKSDDWAITWYSPEYVYVDAYASGLASCTVGTGPVLSAGFNTTVSSVNSKIINFRILRSWDDFTTGFNTRSTIEFPFDPNTFHFHGDMTYLADGDILATGYGTRQGNTKGEVMLISSSDNGVTWQYRSTMIAYESSLMHPDTAPSEPEMMQLSNGNLLCVARCGDINPPVALDPEDVPMWYAISTDLGYTWSTPVSLGVPGVSPRLELLDDGRVAMSYGRPNVYLRLADYTGTNWQEPILVYEGVGSGYTGLRKTPEGDLLIAYAESDFAGADKPGDENYINITKIAINPCEGAYFEADLNKDCAVDLLDYAVIADNWL
ncbi:MAG: sialidase family protein [Sedimentisphaeraceae bacterium JB056]